MDTQPSTSSDVSSGFRAERGKAYLNCRSGLTTLKPIMLQMRFKQEEAKIQAWESDEKRKSETKIKRMEILPDFQLSMILVICVMEWILHSKRYSKEVRVDVMVVVIGIGVCTVTNVKDNAKGFIYACLAVLATSLQQIVIHL
ncbi:hypothetical protein Tco_0729494 [Tanacetum coccineum]|uniref:Uncharacterized protein n=1 Tax=Tanacetum coccineum TaxID=301880 RepID=A0ABQ4YSL4_9ASTR